MSPGPDSLSERRSMSRRTRRRRVHRSSACLTHRRFSGGTDPCYVLPSRSFVKCTSSPICSLRRKALVRRGAANAGSGKCDLEDAAGTCLAPLRSFLIYLGISLPTSGIQFPAALLNAKQQQVWYPSGSGDLPDPEPVQVQPLPPAA